MFGGSGSFGNGAAMRAEAAVPAALACFLARPDDAAEVIAVVVCLGGDTDTIAAMAGAQVGAHVGAAALPQHLLARLEARDELIDLADHLAACCVPRRPPFG